MGGGEECHVSPVVSGFADVVWVCSVGWGLEGGQCLFCECFMVCDFVDDVCKCVSECIVASDAVWSELAG